MIYAERRGTERKKEGADYSRAKQGDKQNDCIT